MATLSALRHSWHPLLHPYRTHVLCPPNLCPDLCLKAKVAGSITPSKHRVAVGPRWEICMPSRYTTKARRMASVMPSYSKSCITSKRSRGCCLSIAATSLPPYMSSSETSGSSSPFNTNDLAGTKDRSGQCMMSIVQRTHRPKLNEDACITVPLDHDDPPHVPGRRSLPYQNR